MAVTIRTDRGIRNPHRALSYLVLNQVNQKVLLFPHVNIQLTMAGSQFKKNCVSKFKKRFHKKDLNLRPPSVAVRKGKEMF